jgi:hypothetical protein
MAATSVKIAKFFGENILRIIIFCARSAVDDSVQRGKAVVEGVEFVAR